MDLLLLGADTPLGLALQRLLAHWGRHRADPVTLAATRFRSERQAKKIARRGGPDVVIDLRLPALMASGEPLSGAEVDRSHWLAKACQRSDMLYLLLSSDRVFAGDVARPRRHNENCDAEDEPGRTLIELESRVVDAAPGAGILRTGPLFAASDDGLLSPLLHQFATMRRVRLDDSRQFCPSSVADVARVIAAVLDQYSVGADASGVFHYCSTDRTTRYGFAEVVLACAGQYLDLGDVELEAVQGDDADLPDGGAGKGDDKGDESPIGDAADAGGSSARFSSCRILDCSRLRDVFAIKQLPWRGQINDVVKNHILENHVPEKKEAASH